MDHLCPCTAFTAAPYISTWGTWNTDPAFPVSSRSNAFRICTVTFTLARETLYWEKLIVRERTNPCRQRSILARVLDRSVAQTTLVHCRQSSGFNNREDCHDSLIYWGLSASFIPFYSRMLPAALYQWLLMVARLQCAPMKFVRRALSNNRCIALFCSVKSSFYLDTWIPLWKWQGKNATEIYSYVRSPVCAHLQNNCLQ